MTGEQCRKARERLDCTRSELATAAEFKKSDLRVSKFRNADFNFKCQRL
jgi:hypothetical protein